MEFLHEIFFGSRPLHLLHKNSIWVALAIKINSNEGQRPEDDRGRGSYFDPVTSLTTKALRSL